MSREKPIDLTEDSSSDETSHNLSRLSELSERLNSVGIDTNELDELRRSPTPKRGFGSEGFASGAATPESSRTPKRKADDATSADHNRSLDTSTLRSTGRRDPSLGPVTSISSSSSDEADFGALSSKRPAKRLRNIVPPQDESVVVTGSSDGEPEQQTRSQERRALSPDRSTLRNPQGIRQSRPSRTVVLDVDQSEDEILKDDVAYSTLPLQDGDDEIQIVRTISRRGSQPSAEFAEIDEIKENGFRCARGKCVEFKDGNFMRIASVVQDRDRNIWVVGQLLIRHNDFQDTKWPRRHNELVLISKIVRGQLVGSTRRRLTEVSRNRKLILTNHIFPLTSSKDHPDRFEDLAYNKEHGPVFCRWKQSQVIGENWKSIEESIERLSFAEADEGYREEDWRARQRWRGYTTRPSGNQGPPAIDSEDERSTRAELYTFGDAFCGAGGASCGAREAGLQVKFGVDFNEKAMQTYALNFQGKGTDCQLDDIASFIDKATGEERYVDVPRSVGPSHHTNKR